MSTQETESQTEYFGLNKPDQLTKVKSLAEKKFELIRSEAVTLAGQCAAIKITDENTLAMSQQVLSKANQIVKAVEAKRSEIKAPYLQAGKAIDELAKQIMDPLEKAIESGKLQLRKWNDAQAEKDKLAKAESEKRFTFLSDIKKNLEEKVAACKTAEDCEKLIASINKNFPAMEVFGEYAIGANATKNNFINLLTIRRDTFAAAVSNNANAAEIVATKLEEIKTVEEAKEEITATIQETKEIVESNTSTIKSNVRKVPKFEIVDDAKLPRQFLSADEKKIREYMNANKDKITKEGVVIGGVRFYIDEAPVIK